MTIIQEKAGKFLAAHGMAAEAVNLRENADVFIGEMEMLELIMTKRQKNTAVR